MSIHNRSLGNTEQRKDIRFVNNQSMTNGETGVLSYIPYPCTLQACQLAAFSLESNPNLLLTVSRFIVGQGMTTYNIGSTFSPNSFGTSGVITAGISLPASGSSLLLLMANDVLGYVVGGGATAGVFGLVGSFVVQPQQDVRSYLSNLV